jgi:SAM-dependent methyltransferase
MPCFKPLREYLIKLTNLLINSYEIKGTFLEIGCGDGFFTEFLAKKGFSGKAIDLSEEAIRITGERVASYDIVVQKQDILFLEEVSMYDLIISYDVLEHIEEDQITMEKIAKLLNDNGFVIASFPVKRKEWRWDDDNYGHCRRYEIEEIKKIFYQSGLKIVVIWDITFPFIWALRRVYTSMMKPKRSSSNRKEATRKSAFESSAGSGFMMKIAETLLPWKLLFFIQDFFRGKMYGCNVLILAHRLDKKDIT